MTIAAPAANASAFAPLRLPVFAVLWGATVLGNTGTFMRDVASGWLAAGLSDSPFAVALIQAAATIPIFLFAIPAGALSDIVDRRKLLIFVQILLGAVSATLMVLAWTGLLTLPLLVALTFAGGVGAALMGPTWQAIVPELVPRPQLRNAVALNSLGFNIARAIGPAAGGFLLLGFGAAATYGADLASYAFVIAALLWWRRAMPAEDPLRERFGGAFMAGLRYARASRDLHRVLWRAFVFFGCASAIWALLPLVARGILQGGPGLYGLLLGAIGAGAIAGAVVLRALRRRIGNDGVLLVAGLIAAAVTACLAAAPPHWAAIALAAVLGSSWIAALTTLNGTAQAILPDWVRGRGLAVYLTVFNGALAAGSLFWGFVADRTGVSSTLLIAAAVLSLSSIAARRWRLPAGDADLTPSSHWPEPAVAEPQPHDRGPVTITVEYRVRGADWPQFFEAVLHLAEERLRDGAFSWSLAEDAADPELIVESFTLGSWAEHLRQHRRVSKADAALQDELRRLHSADDPPKVRHLLAITDLREVNPKKGVRC